MNQDGCQRAIKKLIEDNRFALVDGFYHQGTYREISDIVFTPLAPPRAYYFIVVLVDTATEGTEPASRNMLGRQRNTYACSVHIVDAAITEQRDTVPYETMSLDFRAFCDRLVGLLRSTNCFTPPSPDMSEFRLLHPERSVQVRSRDTQWSSAEVGFLSIFFATLSFTLEEC